MAHEIEVRGNVMVTKVDMDGDVDALNEMMNATQDAWAEEIKQIAKDFGISESTAGDVWYLRTRSRWTQDLENQLVEAYHAGKPIDSGDVLGRQIDDECRAGLVRR